MKPSDKQKIAQKKRELELEAELDSAIEGCNRGLKRIKRKRVSTVLLRKTLEDLEDGLDEILNSNGNGNSPDGVPERL